MRAVPVMLAGGLAAAAALAGGAALAQHGAPAGGAGDGAAAVAITDRAVVPAVRVVAPGTRVMWVNTGLDRHTVTADDGRFDSGVIVPGGEFAVDAPTTPAVIPYHCTIHAFIRGTLTVSAVSLEAPAVVRAGRPARLAGTVPGAAAGTAVVVERRALGAWTPLAAAATDDAGAFTVLTGPLARRTVLRARVGADVSPAARVAVAPIVVVAPAPGALRVRVAPAGGRIVRGVLERLELDTYMWHPHAAVLLRGGRARVTVPAAGVWRVRVPAPGPGLAGAASRAVAVRVPGHPPH